MLRGRLLGADAATVSGERFETVAEIGNVRVTQIVSGSLDGPSEFRQDHDEWVVLLDGRARLDVEGREMELGPGEWLLLPAQTPHRVLSTQPGTIWLALHATS